MRGAMANGLGDDEVGQSPRAIAMPEQQTKQTSRGVDGGGGPEGRSFAASVGGNRAIRAALKVLLVVGLLLAVPVVSFLVNPPGSAKGEIRSSGAPHGDFVLRPAECYTGDHWDFDGVWVFAETLSASGRKGFKGGLKIVRTRAGGWEAYVENPNACDGFKCQQVFVDSKRCKVFDVAVTDTSMLTGYSGHADIDCAFPGGGRLRVKVTFEGCDDVSEDPPV